MTCPTLQHVETEKISEPTALVWINLHILNKIESYHELEWPSSVIGTIVVRIQENSHHLESQIKTPLKLEVREQSAPYNLSHWSPHKKAF